MYWLITVQVDEELWYLDCISGKYLLNAKEYTYSEDEDLDKELYKPPKNGCGEPRTRDESSSLDSGSGMYRLQSVRCSCTLICVSIALLFKDFSCRCPSQSQWLRTGWQAPQGAQKKALQSQEKEEEGSGWGWWPGCLSEAKGSQGITQKCQKASDFLRSEVSSHGWSHALVAIACYV